MIFPRDLPLPHQEAGMANTVAGIDIHKKVLMVVVVKRSGVSTEGEVQRHRFGTGSSDLHRLQAWLVEQGVEEVVMESTAQYWKPVWYELEPHFRLQLAQAHSNRAPRGRKHDFRDAERLVRRLLAEELILSFVPQPEQRAWRVMTRAKVQLARDRVRLHNQVEALLEEMRIKLSSLLSDLFGVSGLRILHALAEGESDAKKLAALGNQRLHCTEEQLVDALSATPRPIHRKLLGHFLDRLQLVDKQLAELNRETAEAMAQHADTVARLAEVPGFGADSAQQVIAEVGVQASTFPSAAHLASWVGTNPGRQESAEQNQSSRSAKGNKFVRRILTEAAQAAVKTKGSHFQVVFRRLMPRLGYKQALWAIAHRLCRLVWKILHDGVRYVEQGAQRDPKALKQRMHTMARSLRQLGYDVNLDITPHSALARS
jgi:transposase